MNILDRFLNASDKKTLRWHVILPIMLMMGMGFTMLYSTGAGQSFMRSSLFRQLVWFGIGTVTAISLQFFRIRFFNEFAYYVYGLLLLALALTYVMPVIAGAHRWIIIGGFRIQPSELGKLIVVFTLAKFLSDRRAHENQIRTLFMAILLAAVPALLVFKQPDLGTALIYFAVLIPMLYWAGIRPFYLFLVVAPAVSMIAAFNLTAFFIWIPLLLAVLFLGRPGILWGSIHVIANFLAAFFATFAFNNLYPHQIKRIEVFLDPMKDPTGAGYQIIQSITAIGSGGLLGKGLGEGTQTHLRFLPVRDTDFIISVMGEELGLLGVIAILLAFSHFFYWLVTYANTANTNFNSLSLIGMGIMLFVHLFINMGMTVGLLPVTGLPAPFISYGGSFLLTCLITLGLINNIINDSY